MLSFASTRFILLRLKSCIIFSRTYYRYLVPKRESVYYFNILRESAEVATRGDFYISKMGNDSIERHQVCQQGTWDVDYYSALTSGGESELSLVSPALPHDDIHNHSWRFSLRWNLADPKCGFDFRSFLDQLLCRQLPVIWRCNYIVIYVILVAS